MLEIIYDIATKQIKAWNADPTVVGNLIPRNDSEAVIVLPNAEIPSTPSDIFFIDLIAGTVLPNLAYIPPAPPRSQHIGKIVSIDTTKAKPMKIVRKWKGATYNVDCLVSLNIVTLYLAGKIAVNDFVIVSFIDEIPDTTELELAIVIDKVFKSW